jgi:membrane protein
MLRIVILILTIQVAISMLYNFGSVKKRQWKFFSPGSILATILIIISSMAFGYYVDNFSQYNKLYGSIGTLMIIMLWIYINIIGLIIGFELNASIAGAASHAQKRIIKTSEGKRF